MKPKNFSDVAARLDRAAREADERRPGRTPESANLRSVKDQIEALSRGDVASVLREAHRDVQLEIFAPPQFSWISRASGLDEVQKAITHNFDALDDQRPEVLNVVAQGDVVVMIGRERGFIRATGAPYDVQFVHRFTFADGRLAAVRIVIANTTGQEPR